MFERGLTSWATVCKIIDRFSFLFPFPFSSHSAKSTCPDNTGLDSDVDSTTEEGELEQEKKNGKSSVAARLPKVARHRETNTTEHEALKQELPAYLARVNDLHEEFNPLDWWKSNASVLPYWSSIARKIMLLQPSSAAAERVLSLLKSSFGEQQEACFQDYIEASLILQFNKR